MKTKKHKPSQEQILNDPSLRWHPYYLWGELVFSDIHKKVLRFFGYKEGDKAELATVHGIDPLPEFVSLLSIRRPTVMENYRNTSREYKYVGKCAKKDDKIP